MSHNWGQHAGQMRMAALPLRTKLWLNSQVCGYFTLLSFTVMQVICIVSLNVHSSEKSEDIDWSIEKALNTIIIQYILSAAVSTPSVNTAVHRPGPAWAASGRSARTARPCSSTPAPGSGTPPWTACCWLRTVPSGGSSPAAARTLRGWCPGKTPGK